jgi:hypothetical protein
MREQDVISFSRTAISCSQVAAIATKRSPKQIGDMHRVYVKGSSFKPPFMTISWSNLMASNGSTIGPLGPLQRAPEVMNRRNIKKMCNYPVTSFPFTKTTNEWSDNWCGDYKKSYFRLMSVGNREVWTCFWNVRIWHPGISWANFSIWFSLGAEPPSEKRNLMLAEHMPGLWEVHKKDPYLRRLAVHRNPIFVLTTTL